MVFQEKVTIWSNTKVELTKEQEEIVLEKIKLGEIGNANSFVNFIESNFGEACETEYLFETEDVMNPEDNGGYATIHVENDKEIVFLNGNYY